MFKVGVYVFRRHGSKIVYFGRFIPILRTWGALLTGVNRYPWNKFLLWNALGAISWAVLWGALSYGFGNELLRVKSTAEFVALGLAVAITIASGIAVKRRAEDLRACAEREFPGDLSELDAKMKRAA